MKSPLLRAFFTPHVHPRPRKRPPRCTLDCGFKTRETPAPGVGTERPPARAPLFLLLILNGDRLPSKNSFQKRFVVFPKPIPRISPKSYRHNAVPNRFSSRFSTSRTNAPRLLSLPKVGTPSASPKGSHTAAHTAKHGAFRMGWYHYPRSVPHVHKHPRAGYQNSKLCRFGAWSRVLPKNAESLRNSDALMRVAVPKASRPRRAA